MSGVDEKAEESWNADTAPVQRRAPDEKPHHHQAHGGTPTEEGNPHAHDRHTHGVHHGTRHVPESEKKHGGGKSNWGAVDKTGLHSIPDVLKDALGPIPSTAAEKELEPESAQEEKRAMQEAGVEQPPPPQHKLEEFLPCGSEDIGLHDAECTPCSASS